MISKPLNDQLKWRTSMNWISKYKRIKMNALD